MIVLIQFNSGYLGSTVPLKFIVKSNGSATAKANF
jgi:hypothetical protein